MRYHILTSIYECNGSKRYANAASNNHDGLLAMLPVLQTGEAIVVDESVNLPVRTLLALPSADRRPDSEDPVVVPGSVEARFDTLGGWNQERHLADYGEVAKL